MVDAQGRSIKFRGFRIEIGDIEQNLLRTPGINEAAVIVRDGSLIAYVSTSRAWREADIQTALREQIPEVMIPSRIIKLKELPRLRNDKIDKRALQLKDTGDPSFAPRSPTWNGTLVGIWEDVLQQRPLSVTASFLSYGGHSLGAAMIVSRIRKDLDLTFRCEPCSSLDGSIARCRDHEGNELVILLHSPQDKQQFSRLHGSCFCLASARYPFSFARMAARSTFLLMDFACQEPNPMKSLSTQSKG